MEQCVMTTGTMRMPLSSALNLDSPHMVRTYLNVYKFGNHIISY